MYSDKGNNHLMQLLLCVRGMCVLPQAWQPKAAVPEQQDIASCQWMVASWRQSPGIIKYCATCRRHSALFQAAGASGHMHDARHLCTS